MWVSESVDRLTVDLWQHVTQTSVVMSIYLLIVYCVTAASQPTVWLWQKHRLGDALPKQICRQHWTCWFWWQWTQMNTQVTDKSQRTRKERSTDAAEIDDLMWLEMCAQVTLSVTALITQSADNDISHCVCTAVWTQVSITTKQCCKLSTANSTLILRQISFLATSFLLENTKTFLASTLTH